ncbi:MAG: VanZ family protein [candidate division KSB1 bacterium]|nr:VanZ family protein [candidate division KSB1 bacterium]
MGKFFLQHWPVIAWALLLFTLSSIPNPSSLIHLASWDDKWEHLLAYIPFGWLLMRSFTMKTRGASHAYWQTIVTGVLFGISDEIHQYFVPGRFMDWRDAVADAVGVILGGWLFIIWQQRKRHREPITQPWRRETPLSH